MLGNTMSQVLENLSLISIGHFRSYGHLFSVGCLFPHLTTAGLAMTSQCLTTPQRESKAIKLI